MHYLISNFIRMYNTVDFEICLYFTIKPKMSEVPVEQARQHPLLFISNYIDSDLDDQEAPKNFGGPLPKFKWLCENLFVKLDRIFKNPNYYNRDSITQQKIHVIEVFLKEWRETVGPNIYPALRLILPHKDSSRLYNMKDHTMGKLILEILKIPKNSETTKLIMKWKRSKSSKEKKFSDICVEVIQSRRQDVIGGVLSISEVNDLLDRLARHDSKRNEQLEMLNLVINSMCFVELKYFFDIVMKRNIVRNMENAILNIWHPDAQRYLSVVTGLKTVAYKLFDPTKRLTRDELTINIGKPFGPQLSLRPRLTYPKIVAKLENDFFIEQKMDGERIQLHYENYGEKIRYWSRKATDYTHLYGPSLNEGCISPHLKFIDSVKECVLDGEMITYDPLKNAILPFGVLKGSALSELQRLNDESCTERSPARPLFMVFDLLYLNGKSLTNFPLETRKKWLQQILIQTPTFVEIIDSVRVDSEDAIKKSIIQAIEKGYEGVILKQVKSKYLISKRSEFWVKIKPEYLEEFGENVDLVVIGRERSQKDMFFCGVRITKDDTANELCPHFWSFCRVANGFDQEEYRKIDQLTKGKWKDMNKVKPPSDLIEFGKRVPPEWIDPRDSFVIEVKARSIDRSVSKNYKTSTTLYNAYNRRIREDKDWKTATTLIDYQMMKESHTSVQSVNHDLINKKRETLKRRRITRDEEVWNQDERRGEHGNTNIFDGLIFIVLSDAFLNQKRIEIDEIHQMIHNNGGRVTKNETKISDFGALRIISDKRTMQEVALKSQGFDILRPSWVFQCIVNRTLLNIEPSFCFDVNDELLEIAKTRVDSFGDSYTVPTNSEMLKELLLNYANTMNDEDGIDENLYEIYLFNGLRIYVDRIEQSEDSFKYDEVATYIELFGATLVDDLDEATIVVVPEYKEIDLVTKEVERIRRYLASSAQIGDSTIRTKRLVTSKWVFDSVKHNSLVDAQDYQVITTRD